MPISLPPITRRRFLKASAAAGTALLAGRSGLAEEVTVDSNRFALLADTHVSGNRDAVVRGAHMANNLKQVGERLVAQEVRPGAVMIDGDCAYLSGEAADYRVLVDLLTPIRKSGLPVHLTLGNHDHRERFWQAVPPGEDEDQQVEDRHVTVINAPHANWILLDSLDVTNKTPGRLGEQQLTWLAELLDTRTDRPALVMVHHNPDVVDRITGLLDTQAFLDVLQARKHVKAFFFGHTHNWSVRQQDGLHLVNLPPVAYVFRKDRPNGWVDIQLEDNGATLELSCLDTSHQEHGDKVKLQWRT